MLYLYRRYKYRATRKNKLVCNRRYKYRRYQWNTLPPTTSLAQTNKPNKRNCQNYGKTTRKPTKCEAGAVLGKQQQ